MRKPLTPDQLKKIRAQLGVTQTGLAKLLHTTIDTISSWEQGRRPISMITTFAILHVFCNTHNKRPRPHPRVG